MRCDGLWQIVPVMFIVSIVIFSIIHFIPGNPAQIIAGPNATPEQLAAFEARWGWTNPSVQQYFIWLRNVLTGDLGVSYINKFPVSQMILQRIPATVELAFASVLIGVVIALPLGIAAALRPGSKLDFAVTTFSALSFAMPRFLSADLADHTLQPGTALAAAIGPARFLGRSSALFAVDFFARLYPGHWRGGQTGALFAFVAARGAGPRLCAHRPRQRAARVGWCWCAMRCPMP